jgi:hypothetical protein
MDVQDKQDEKFAGIVSTFLNPCFDLLLDQRRDSN